jgi:hypothetical protein
VEFTGTKQGEGCIEKARAEEGLLGREDTGERGGRKEEGGQQLGPNTLGMDS